MEETLRVVASSEVLTAALGAAIAWQMARVLIARGADLPTGRKAMKVLRKAGFGGPTVRALHHRAALMARAFLADTNSPKGHAL